MPPSPRRLKQCIVVSAQAVPMVAALCLPEASGQCCMHEPLRCETLCLGGPCTTRAGIRPRVLPTLALAFAQELDPSAVDLQLQGLRAGPIADLDQQRLLAPAHRAVVWHWPVQPGQPHRQRALCLPSRVVGLPIRRAVPHPPCLLLSRLQSANARRSLCRKRPLGTQLS